MSFRPVRKIAGRQCVPGDNFWILRGMISRYTSRIRKITSAKKIEGTKPGTDSTRLESTSRLAYSEFVGRLGPTPSIRNHLASTSSVAPEVVTDHGSRRGICFHSRVEPEFGLTLGSSVPRMVPCASTQKCL